MGRVDPAVLTLAAILATEITHGADDATDPAVVGIVDSSGTTGCTGTVIAAHFVLTAAHCILPNLKTGAHAVFGASAASPSAAISIVAFSVDPSFDPQTLDYDAAILVLGAAATVTPIPMASSASPPPAVGSTIRVVGWGVTSADAGDAGMKRQGTARVTAVGALTLTVVPDASQPCLGDSGGPLLATIAGTEVVAGITSHGDEACQQSAVYTRVDVVQSAFIAPTLASLGDGTVAAGGRCLYPEQCQGGASACVVAPDDASVRYCTQACSTSSGCPAGMRCVSQGASGSQCRYPVPTPGAMGATCKADGDCVDASCLVGVCTEACSSINPSCPVGFTCQSSDGIDSFCLAAPPAPSKGGGCALAPGDIEAAWALPALGLVLLAKGRRRRAGPGRP